MKLVAKSISSNDTWMLLIQNLYTSMVIISFESHATFEVRADIVFCSKPMCGLDGGELFKTIFFQGYHLW